MKNRKGQSATELILIMALFVGLATIVASTFKSQDVFANFVNKPWQVLSGMIQNGVWLPTNQALTKHPSQPSRRRTPVGDAT